MGVVLILLILFHCAVIVNPSRIITTTDNDRLNNNNSNDVAAVGTEINDNTCSNTNKNDNNNNNGNECTAVDSSSSSSSTATSSSSSSSTSSSPASNDEKHEMQRRHHHRHPQYHFLTPNDLPLPELYVFDNKDDDNKSTITINATATKNTNTTNTEEEEMMIVKVLRGSIQQLQPTGTKKSRRAQQLNDVDSNTSRRESSASASASASTSSSAQQQSQSQSQSFHSEFTVVPEFPPRTVVAELLILLRGHENKTVANGHTTFQLNTDPDTVDGYTTQEFYLDNDMIRQNKGYDTMEMTSKQQQQQQQQQHQHPNNNNNNNNNEQLLSETEIDQRQQLRQKLHAIMDPYQEKITKIVHSILPDKCKKRSGTGSRDCTPCYSLLRRYRSGERQAHAPHIDGHSFVTVVVSLSDYGLEYTGGLYISTQVSQRQYIPLFRGDAVFHQSDLHHGVQVYPPNTTTTTTNDNDNEAAVAERWSWIIWFRDSTTCQDHRKEWYTSCPGQQQQEEEDSGNPLCTYLRATTSSEAHQVLQYLQQASAEGHPHASVKLGWAYLKALHSALPFDLDKATALFHSAIAAPNEPDGHYGLATIYLAQARRRIQSQPTKERMKEVAKEIHNMGMGMTASQSSSSSSLVVNALYHLEEAAKCGHVFSMFNLGIAALYGYGRRQQENAVPQPQQQPHVAADWFEASGLPEGLAARSWIEGALFHHPHKAQQYHQRATLLGYGASWRKQARQNTGSGGFVGAQLNLQWPPLYPTGQIPEEW